MSTFRISESSVFRELEGESVLLNLDSGMYFGLDQIGTRVWQLLETHGRIEPILKALGEEYDVAPDTLRKDVGDLISALTDKGLVVEREDGAARA